MRYTWYLIMWFCFPLVASAQDTSTINYTIQPAPVQLPNSDVKGIAQDQRGFIWLATESGLYRYEGLSSKVFKLGMDADVAIGFNRINHMHKVFDRYLILEGEKGVNILDMLSEHVLFASPDDQVLLSTLIYKPYCYLLLEDEQGKTSLYQLLPDGRVDSTVQTFPAGIHLLAACTNAKGSVYGYGTDGKLWLLDPGSGITACVDSVHLNATRSDILPNLYCDGDNQLWIVDQWPRQDGPGIVFSPGSNPRRVSIRQYPITTIMDEDPDIAWYFDLQAQTLYKHHLHNDQLEKIIYIPGLISELYCVLEDQQGNLWIGSTRGSGNGLLIAHPHIRAFHKLLYQPGLETSRGLACRGMAEMQNGNILMGTFKGMYTFNPASGHVTDLDVKNNLHMPIENIWSICADETHHSIWVSNEGSQLYEYAPVNTEQKTYFNTSNTALQIMGMTMDRRGVLWAGTNNSFLWFDTHTHTFATPNHLDPALYGAPCYQWVQTDPNSFWLCSAIGLFRFDSLRRMVAKYDLTSVPQLPVQSVYDIVQDDPDYWIGTEDGLYQLSGNKITGFTTRDGLPSNSIADLALDREGNLWLATYWGLSRREKVTGVFQNFFAEDGLPSNEFNRAGKLITHDGHIFFSSQNGVLWFDPEAVTRTIPALPLVLTDFSTFSADGTQRHASAEELSDLTTVTIPAGNKYFEFEFALLNFIKPESNQYSYYLEGMENSWRSMVTVPYIQFNNLPPGHYTLHIRAKSPTGQLSSNTLDIAVHIRQHLYQSTLFWMGLILLVAGIAFLLFRYRLTQRLHMEQMRNRISSDLHDEVGGVLSGVAMQMDVLQGRSPDHLKPFMQRVAESSRNAAARMRDVIWSIDSSKEHFQDLLERMKAYTIELFGSTDIHYRFEIKDINPAQRLSLDLRQHLYLIFKEALHNIFKHANASEVIIHLDMHKNRLFLSIQDNGIGIPDDPVTSGQGLRNMRRRAEKLRGDLSITRRAEAGTKIELHVPVKSQEW